MLWPRSSRALIFFKPVELLAVVESAFVSARSAGFMP